MWFRRRVAAYTGDLVSSFRVTLSTAVTVAGRTRGVSKASLVSLAGAVETAMDALKELPASPLAASSDVLVRVGGALAAVMVAAQAAGAGEVVDALGVAGVAPSLGVVGQAIAGVRSVLSVVRPLVGAVETIRGVADDSSRPIVERVVASARAMEPVVAAVVAVVNSDVGRRAVGAVNVSAVWVALSTLDAACRAASNSSGVCGDVRAALQWGRWPSIVPSLMAASAAVRPPTLHGLRYDDIEGLSNISAILARGAAAASTDRDVQHAQRAIDALSLGTSYARAAAFAGRLATAVARGRALVAGMAGLVSDLGVVSRQTTAVGVLSALVDAVTTGGFKATRDAAMDAAAGLISRLETSAMSDLVAAVHGLVNGTNSSCALRVAVGDASGSVAVPADVVVAAKYVVRSGLVLAAAVQRVLGARLAAADPLALAAGAGGDVASFVAAAAEFLRAASALRAAADASAGGNAGAKCIASAAAGALDRVRTLLQVWPRAHGDMHS